jgi:hypothetical protein
VSLPEGKIPDSIEDLSTRPPEWQEIERGYGHETVTRLRTIEFDPIHRWTRSSGPTVLNQPPEKPAP